MKIMRVIVVLFSVAVAIPGFAQTITGKWVGPWRVLDNGENDRVFLDLQQAGPKVTGTLKTIESFYTLEGTATGNHFELFSSKLDAKPRIVGDATPNELHLTWRNHSVVAVPAKAGDEYASIERIAPPSPSVVPYNGLAKTPPMG